MSSSTRNSDNGYQPAFGRRLAVCERSIRRVQQPPAFTARELSLPLAASPGIDPVPGLALLSQTGLDRAE
jgi:hypothetical protein